MPYSRVLFDSSGDRTQRVTFRNIHDDETYQQFKMAADKPEVIIALDC